MLFVANHIDLALRCWAGILAVANTMRVRPEWHLLKLKTTVNPAHAGIQFHPSNQAVVTGNREVLNDKVNALSNGRVRCDEHAGPARSGHGDRGIQSRR
jgi:hypothetical protein